MISCVLNYFIISEALFSNFLLMHKTDIFIIGAGVIGFAVADKLNIMAKSVTGVESNPSFGVETSSRNSEVIYGGIYHSPRQPQSEIVYSDSRAS